MNRLKTDIEHRRPIWEQLSNLYLDTELGDEDISSICTTIQASPYDLQAVKEIDLYEVFPILQMNLMSMAGEWAGFDREQLYKKCEEAYSKRNNRLYRFTCKLNHHFWCWMRKDYWIRIEQQMNKSELQ